MAQDNGANWAQARQRIDANEARDLDKPPEPAMASLGTDDEAAGQTTSPTDLPPSLGPDANIARTASKRFPAWMVVGVVVVLAAVIFLLVGAGSS